jgi:RNA polymerase sigma factor (sigma-70 family)
MEAGVARTDEAARKRAAVEMVANHGSALKATARRFSIDAEDAEDAFQRALEIVLTKAPTTSPRDLIRWTQTVIKHEALAVRQGRERLHGYRRSDEDRGLDPVANLVAPGGAPDERVERGEEIARAREALRALKPAELRALGLLAEGYSYAEIGDLTGFSKTKVNRLLAEGRDRFRRLFASSEDGSRCRELRPLLSAFCDGETRSRDADLVREHLRACARCRATMRAYRAAPRIALGLVPALPPSRSLLERIRQQLGDIEWRLPEMGMAGNAVAAQVTAIACVAAGALPATSLTSPRERQATIERIAVGATKASGGAAKTIAARRDRRQRPAYERAAGARREPEREAAPAANVEAAPEAPGEATSPASPPAEAEYAPPAAAPAPSPSEGEGTNPGSASAAGEFGP